MKRFLLFAFTVILFSSLSVVALASSYPLDDSLDNSLDDSLEINDISSVFNVVGSATPFYIPKDGFMALFDYNPFTQVATARFPDEYIKSISPDVRAFFESMEANPSRYHALIRNDPEKFTIYFVENPLVDSPFGLLAGAGKWHSPNTFLRCVFMSTTPSAFSFPSHVYTVKEFPRNILPYAFKLNYSTSIVLGGVQEKQLMTSFPVSEFRFLSRASSVTVLYKDSNGVDVFPPVSQTIPIGGEYSIDSPVLAGCSPSHSIVSGVMTSDDIVFTVVYSPNPYKITVNFVDKLSRSIAPSFVGTVYYNSPYSVPCPNVDGYTSDSDFVSGIMPAGDFSDTGTYSGNPYTLTVNYLDISGFAVYPSYSAVIPCGDSYIIDNPIIEGFDTSFSSVSGNMPSNNYSISVIYKKADLSFKNILSDSLDSMKSSVFSNVVVLVYFGLLLFGIFVSVFLILRILRNFSRFF